VRPGFLGLRAAPGRPSSEQIPAGSIEPKPACDQAARLRAALCTDIASPGARLLVRGVKGGVGTTTVSDLLREILEPLGTVTIDAGVDPAAALRPQDACLVVTTPEPAALAAAFDGLRSLALPAPLLVVNRAPSFAASRRAFDRLGAALAGVGSIGTLFAGHVPFDPLLARSFGRAERFLRAGSPAGRACVALAGRLAAFLGAVNPSASDVPCGGDS
jgi:hypothetical protein